MSTSPADVAAPSPERLKTARMVLEQLSTPDGRQLLKQCGYSEGDVVVPCEWNAPLAGVIADASRGNPQLALIAVRYDDQLRWCPFLSPARELRRYAKLATAGELVKQLVKQLAAAEQELRQQATGQVQMLQHGPPQSPGQW